MIFFKFIKKFKINQFVVLQYDEEKENIYDSYISHKENILFTLKINKFAR